MSRGREQFPLTNYEVSMTQGEEEEGLGARVAGAGQLCPGIRSVKVTINMDTVLYCTVLYCTVLYCTVLYCTVLYCTV